MKPIEITGLTQEQVDMLDIMWSFDSLAELEEWRENLDSRELAMSMSLQQILLLETVEQLLMEDREIQRITELYLQRFRL